MYTKGAVVQTPQTHVSSSAVTANAGTVTDVTIVEQPAAVALGPAAVPAAEFKPGIDAAGRARQRPMCSRSSSAQLRQSDSQFPRCHL